jgi:hypothetical protein
MRHKATEICQRIWPAGVDALTEKRRLNEMTRDVAQELFQELSQGNITLSEAGAAFGVSRQAVRKRLSTMGFTLTVQRGRKTTPVNPDIREAVLAHRALWNEGYIVVAMQLNVSKWDVMKVFVEEKLFLHERELPVANEHDKRWEAEKAGQLIHTDQHMSRLFGRQDVVAFMCSVSRKVLWGGVVEN